MTKDETYEFIGRLAMGLYSQNIRISLGSLRSILADADRGSEYGSGRAMASGAKAACRYWERKGDGVVAGAIAYTFTSKDGTLAWSEESEGGDSGE